MAAALTGVIDKLINDELGNDLARDTKQVKCSG
jgi:hypothetical protein